jgi:cytokinin dehydrogenase
MPVTRTGCRGAALPEHPPAPLPGGGQLRWPVLAGSQSGGALSADVMLTANRALFEEGRALGGYQYPIGSIPMTEGDWRQHFGPQWPFLAAARQRYDPAGILTPGQGIFSPGSA